MLRAGAAHRPPPDGAGARRRAELRGLADRYAEGEGAVLVVPRQDRESAVILTAWRKILRLKEWGPKRAQAFIDRYLGVDHHQG